MKKSVLVLASLLITLSALGQTEKPKLIVGIVVDQMKQEYAWRFRNHFGDNGFNRFFNEGFVSKNAHYNYASTSTGPGHASVYTGTTPAHHGIVNNSWYSRLLKRSVYCAEDTTARAVGGSLRAGRISPANLYASTITDELKLFTQQEGKVVAMSIKDRGSALPGGHLSDGSYWYDSRTGNFMTSTFYMEELPKWVKKFNEKKLADEYLNETWNTLLPIKTYNETGEDNSPYERGFRGKDTPTFPYNLAELRAENGNFGMLPSTPWGNTILNDLAIASVEGEELGMDDVTDFLAVSFSSPDYIGHNFGPQAKEVQDTYVRLDRELERLFNYLDEKVGKGNYTVFLSADHAVAENSQRMDDMGFRIKNLNSRGLSGFLQLAVAKKYGAEEWFEAEGYDIFLNHDLIAEKKIDLYEMQLFVAQEAMKYEGVYMALTGTDLIRNQYTDGIRSLIQKTYHPKESGDVRLVLDPGWQRGGVKGTGHGNAWTYDTHIPVMFYGMGIQKGQTTRKVNVTDIAPTISMLMEMRLPNAATGTPVHEALKLN